MKKKAFGIVLLVLAALVLLQGNSWDLSLGKGKDLGISDWYSIFLPESEQRALLVNITLAK